MSKNAELQATDTVNQLLGSLLPGAKKIAPGEGKRSRQSSGKGSRARLIDRNLKRMVELQERDQFALRKRQKKLKASAIKSNRRNRDMIEQAAKLKVLDEHLKQETLSAKEQKYLNKMAERNARRLSSWDLEDDEREDLRELQERIISQTSGTGSGSKRSQARKKRGKNFKEDIKPMSTDHRYPGLTPGLAPVGLSDEEDSSDED